jgi:small subunit ribosomal protein S6e
MAFKLNISDKGKAWKVETESEYLIGKSFGDKISGSEIKPELEGYELTITGGSDISGFPMHKEVEGIGLKKLLFIKGWGMKNKQSGLRLRKSVRGKTVSPSYVQINMKVVKAGSKALAEVFPEQNQPKAPKAKAAPAA